MKKGLEISTSNYFGSVDIEVMLSLRTAVALVGSTTSSGFSFLRSFFLALFLIFLEDLVPDLL